MEYTSTRNNKVRVTSAQAIAQGISPDGGLFVPCEIPSISLSDIVSLSELDYRGRAAKVLGLYLTDFTADELAGMVGKAYGEKFDTSNPAPLHKLSSSEYVQELWHGPTCAFKDMALQLLPYLLTASAAKTSPDKTIVILVATSGDTGKAALEGFRDVDGTKIMVFYPVDGVSNMQKLQMMTQEGENVAVCAIEGNFDDAQTGVKKIFTDSVVKDRLASAGMYFSSANSINWGRLVPQIVYYVSAYCDLLNEGAVKLGDSIDVVVPTGNFGNILAAYYAKKMGIPIGKLVCASNANNVLTDFISTGTYDRNREFFATVSPSMDILISSNLERLLYHVSGEDSEKIACYMKALSDDGKYTVETGIKDAVSELFSGVYCDDKTTAKVISETFDKYGYLVDTHTAVALNAYNVYSGGNNDDRVTVVVSTASPFKFTTSVLPAVKTPESADDFELMNELADFAKIKVPAPLASLQGKAKRFEDVCAPDEMPEAVIKMLGI